MLRHAVWLLNRFQLDVGDNKTSFQRRWGIAYSNAVLPFGELVLAQDQSLAFWLGRCEATDEHILAKANSSSLVKSRSVTRLSLESSVDLTLLKSTGVPPPELASAAYLKMAELGDQPIAKAGEKNSLGGCLHLKLTSRIPSTRQKADSQELCLSNFHQDWHSHLQHKLVHMSCQT